MLPVQGPVFILAGVVGPHAFADVQVELSLVEAFGGPYDHAFHGSAKAGTCLVLSLDPLV